MRTAIFSLIESVVVDKYIKRRAPDEKLIVFAAGIETCTILTDYLRATHSEIDVRRYAEKDPFMNVINADVRVTTLLSAATAVDIPNLIINTMTVTVSSQCSNVQGFGRPRKLASNRVQEFVFLSCAYIDKHLTYHECKIDLLRSRTLNFPTRNRYSPV